MNNGHARSPLTVNAKQACEAVGITAASLYAYVSRGLVRTTPDPTDARRSLYNRRDIETLIDRKKRSRSRSDIAQSTIDWGEPILRSGVSQIQDGRLFYRKQDVVELSESSSVEAVAALLTGMRDADFADRASVAHENTGLDPLGRITVAVAAEAAQQVGNDGPRRAEHLIGCVIAAGCGVGALPNEPIHHQVSRGLGVPREGTDVIRKALILCADHELNPSSYAARIAASTGANLASALLVGVATFNGPKHGRMPNSCAQWLDKLPGAINMHSSKLPPPGFGHRLYPDGDIRASNLLEVCAVPAVWQRKTDDVLQLTGHRPNVTFAIACIERRFGLPTGSGSALFAVSRSIGWISHILEQRKSGSQIRPRASS
jgi:citrate synthase